MTETLDMMELARFAAMPGAARLVRAFGEIPPGPLRDSVIHHAEVIGQTYAAAPAEHRMPDPVRSIPVIGALPSPPPTRTGRAPPPINEPGGRDDEIIRLRVEERLKPKAIAERLGIHSSTVFNALAAARKAGVPGIPPPQTSGRRAADAEPAPAAPKAATKRNRPEEKKKWHTTLDSLSGQGRFQVEKAAKERGIEAQAYLDRRQRAVELALEGKGYNAILEATGETDQKVVSTWMSNARAAGFNVPFLTADGPGNAWDKPTGAIAQRMEAKAAREATAPPQDGEPRRFFKPASAMPQAAAVAVYKAAQRRGISVADYEALRETIVRHRLDGRTPAQISGITGQGKQFVKDTLDAAGKLGVTFPALAEEDGGRSFEPPELKAAE